MGDNFATGKGKEWYDLEFGKGAGKPAASPFVLECLGEEEKAFWGG